MIESIEREGTKVVIKINTGLSVEKPVVCFTWDCQYEYVAEWVQFASLSDYRKGGKLHAVEIYKGFRDNESICGRWTPLPFFEPTNTKSKCKNCERKLNGK